MMVGFFAKTESASAKKSHKKKKFYEQRPGCILYVSEHYGMYCHAK